MQWTGKFDKKYLYMITSKQFNGVQTPKRKRKRGIIAMHLELVGKWSFEPISTRTLMAKMRR